MSNTFGTINIEIVLCDNQMYSCEMKSQAVKLKSLLDIDIHFNLSTFQNQTVKPHHRNVHYLYSIEVYDIIWSGIIQNSLETEHLY